jgi:hypothetical protein
VGPLLQCSKDGLRRGGLRRPHGTRPECPRCELFALHLRQAHAFELHLAVVVRSRDHGAGGGACRMRCSTTAKLRASATFAFFRPARWATRSAQFFRSEPVTACVRITVPYTAEYTDRGSALLSHSDP